MEFREIKDHKKEYLPLLLLGDEQESMIDQYLERGWMYVLEDHGVKAVCVVTEETKEILELKNLAVEKEFQHQGYGKAVIDFLLRRYQGTYRILQVGTGDSPSTLPFYESCGFYVFSRIKDFFILNYDHPIWEMGVQLKDMVYLRREL